MESGVYYLECLVNSKKYIGSAQNLHGRKVEHFKNLRNGTNNKLIQEDFNKYGEENFKFEILEILPNDDAILVEKENYYMDYFKTYIHKYGSAFGYNQHRASRNRPTEESNKKRSESLKGKNISLTLEQCFEIKRLLLEENKYEKMQIKMSRIAENYKVSSKTIKKIFYGDYWCSESLEGSYKDWVKKFNSRLIDKIKSEIQFLEKSVESVSEIDKSIANKFNISQRTAQRIRLNDDNVTLRR